MIAAAISGAAGIAAFVALGGAGLAQTAIAPTQSQTAAPDEPQSGKKVVICHKLKNTISVSVNAWPAHKRHGDTEGACAAAAPTQTTTEPTKQMKPKKSTHGTDATPTTSDEESNEPDDTTSGSQPPKQHKQHKPQQGGAALTTTPHGNSGKPKNPKHANGQSKHAAVTGESPQSGGHGNGNGNGK